MPDETSAQPAARRRSQPEESGGGKILPIILTVLLLGLGFALFKRNGSANAQAEKDALIISTLNSNINELRTKVVLEQGNAGVVQSNHLAMLDRRTAELVTTSNRLVQTRLQLEREEASLLAARNDLSARAADLGALQAERNESLRQNAVIPGLQHETAELKDKLMQAQFAHAALQETLGRVRAEKADLERKLEDPLFLRLQERQVLQGAEMRQRAAAGQHIDASDPRVRLELQPDGTVRPAIAASAAPKK